jgi:hypothetical protein
MGVAAEQAVLEFLRRRYASAIACGDDRTATRLRGELDRLMNDRRRVSEPRVGPELPELPPAA